MDEEVCDEVPEVALYELSLLLQAQTIVTQIDRLAI